MGPIPPVMEFYDVAAADLGLTESRAFQVRGRIPPGPRLAIVGSRAALTALRQVVEVLVAEAKQLGATVVSGGALGIDGAVHRAALDQGVPQLVVLPCGADRIYPGCHAELFQRVVAAGHSGLLFAHPRGTPPVRATFVSRNKTLVAVADACVVVQAEVRSGSETTGRLALRAGRKLAAVVGTPGCAALVAAGATAIAAEPLEQVRASVRAWWAGGAVQRPWPEHLQWLRERMVSAQRRARGWAVDELGGPMTVVALCEAETLGLVATVGGGRWVCV